VSFECGTGRGRWERRECGSARVKVEHDAVMPISRLTLTLTRRVLEKAGVVKPREGGWDVEMFVRTDVARIV
jgi:hypothetical protein